MDLVEIVAEAHLPFPVVALKDVVRVSELARVSLRLARLKSTGAAEGRLIVNKVSICRPRRLEALVVPARVAGQAATGFARHRVGGGTEAAHVSTDK